MADRLVEAEIVALAREDPARPFTYAPVALLRGGDPPPIPFLVDSATRRRLAAAAEDAVLMAHEPESGWVQLAYANKDVRQAADPTEVVLARLAERQDTLAGSVVRLLIKIRAEQEPAWRDREIRKALEEVYSVAISKDVEHPARVRLGSFSPETMTPPQLLMQYFHSREVDPQRIEQLVDYAERIIGE